MGMKNVEKRDTEIATLVLRTWCTFRVPQVLKISSRREIQSHVDFQKKIIDWVEQL